MVTLAGLRGRISVWRRARHLATNPFGAMAFFLLPEHFGQPTCSFAIDGVRFSARRRDWVALEEVLLGGEYAFAPALVGAPEPLVVDLGANVGLFSLQLFSRIRGGSFLLVEPSHRTAQLLRENIAANSNMRGRVSEAAVWVTDGFIDLHEDPSASTAAAIDARKNTTTPSRVACIRLESLLHQHSPGPIDLVKMDIEGAEQAVLEQSRELLPKIESLVVEVHPPTSSVATVAALLASAFPFLYSAGRRGSVKTLLVAARRPQPTLRPYVF